MIDELLLALAATVYLTFVGLAVGQIAPASWQRHLALGAPVVGAAALSVALHLLGIVLPVRQAGAGLVIIAVGVLVWRRHSIRAALPPAKAGLMTAAAATVILVIMLVPAIWNPDATAMHVTPNHDAFFYVSTAQWLADAGLSEPALSPIEAPGSQVPFFGPAASSMEQSLRLGENLVAAGLVDLLPGDSERLWLPLAALWGAFLVPAAAVCARAAGLPWGVSALVGALTAGHALVAFQVFNQNSPSVLGMGFVLLLAALLPAALAQGGRLIPLAALLLAALVGTYTELAVVSAPALAAVVLLRRRSWLTALRRGTFVVVLSLAVAPVVYLRAIDSLRTVAAAGAIPGALNGSTPITAAAKAFGTRPFDAPSLSTSPSWLLVVATCAIAAWLAIGLIWSYLLPSRLFWLAFAATVALLGYTFVAEEPTRGYSLARLTAFSLPLVFAGAALGLLVAGWRHDWRAGSKWTAVALTSTSIVIAVNVMTTWATLSQARGAIRIVDGAYAEAASWIEARDPEGAGVSVAAFDFVNQLWIAEAARKQPAVSYPVLDPSYFRVPSAWDGAADRYLLVDTGAMWNATPKAVVGQNARFTLLDTAASEVVAFVPQGITSGSGWLPNWPLGIPRTDGDRQPDAWMASSASAFLAAPAGGAVTLDVVTPTDSGPTRLSVSGDGIEPAEGTLAGEGSITVRMLPGVAASRLLIEASSAEPVPTGGGVVAVTGVTLTR